MKSCQAFALAGKQRDLTTGYVAILKGVLYRQLDVYSSLLA